MNSQIKNRQRKLTDQVHNTTFQKEKTIMITQQNQIGIYSQLKQEQDKRASKKVLQLGNTFLRCFLI